MTSPELTLHAKLSLLLNGYGSVQNGQINISVSGFANKQTGEIEQIYWANSEKQFSEFIAPDSVRNN